MKGKANVRKFYAIIIVTLFFFILISISYTIKLSNEKKIEIKHEVGVISACDIGVLGKSSEHKYFVMFRLSNDSKIFLENFDSSRLTQWRELCNSSGNLDIYYNEEAYFFGFKKKFVVKGLRKM